LSVNTTMLDKAPPYNIHVQHHIWTPQHSSELRSHHNLLLCMCADKPHSEYSLVYMADKCHVLVMIVLRVCTISGTAYVQIEHTHGIQVHTHASMAKGCNMILAWQRQWALTVRFQRHLACYKIRTLVKGFQSKDWSTHHL
jgi:hypothetical protein